MKSLLPLALCIAVSSGLSAQARPDFSGQWTEVPAAMSLSTNAPAGRPDQGTLAVGNMGSGWGSPLTIAQDATQLVVDETVFNRYDAAQQPHSVYALDGSETRNTVMLSHTAQVRVSRTQWDGQALRITTLYPGTDPSTGKPMTTEVVHRLSLESPDRMLVEVTRGVTSTRTIYAKK